MVCVWSTWFGSKTYRSQYYRDLKRRTSELETDVQQLQSEKTEAKTALIAKVGSLLGSGEIKELKQKNRQLRDEVVARDESIERLQTSSDRASTYADTTKKRGDEVLNMHCVYSE